jgi:hypothetical protein
MTAEVSLFWAVAAGFLVFDNFLLIPAGGDYLSLGRVAQWRYSPSSRSEANGRELIFLNPFNLFQRVVLTTRSIGRLNPRDYRLFRQEVARALPRLNSLAWWGYCYLFAAVLLAVATFNFSFASLVWVLIGTHLFFWLTSAVLLLLSRSALGLELAQTVALIAESFFVPAYCINLSKRVWYRRAHDIPALTIGLRGFRRIHDEHLRELMTHEYDVRLVRLSQEFPEDEATLLLIKEARACLKT